MAEKLRGLVITAMQNGRVRVLALFLLLLPYFFLLYLKYGTIKTLFGNHNIDKLSSDFAALGGIYIGFELLVISLACDDGELGHLKGHRPQIFLMVMAIMYVAIAGLHSRLI